jgi:hypothetical protein
MIILFIMAPFEVPSGKCIALKDMLLSKGRECLRRGGYFQPGYSSRSLLNIVVFIVAVEIQEPSTRVYSKRASRRCD